MRGCCAVFLCLLLSCILLAGIITGVVFLVLYLRSKPFYYSSIPLQPNQRDWLLSLANVSKCHKIYTKNDKMEWSTIKSTFSEAENIFLVIQRQERIYGAFYDAKIEIIKDSKCPFCDLNWS